jgi:hypothetical protein
MSRHKKPLPVVLETENNNNPNQLPSGLSESDAIEIIQTIAQAKSADKRAKFFMGYFFNLPMEVCVRISGLSQSYCSALVGKYRRNPKLRTHIDKLFDGWPEVYRNVCKMRLFKLQEAEGKAVEKYLENPELLIDKPQLAKQIKLAAGAMPVDEVPRPMMVNIGEIRAVIQQKMGLLPDGRLTEGSDEED